MIRTKAVLDKGKPAEKLGRKAIGSYRKEDSQLPKEEFFCVIKVNMKLINDKGKPIERLGRKAIGSFLLER